MGKRVILPDKAKHISILKNCSEVKAICLRKFRDTDRGLFLSDTINKSEGLKSDELGATPLILFSGFTYQEVYACQ